MTHKDPIPEEVKDFIIEALACYDSPETVADAVRAEFNLVMHPQRIAANDPTRPAGWNLSDAHSTLFQRIRKNFLASIEDIPVAHKAVRLRALGRMAAEAEEKGNFPVAAKLLEQVAKEVAGAYAGRGPALSEQPVNANEPRHPGDDHLREIAKRYAPHLFSDKEEEGPPRPSQ